MLFANTGTAPRRTLPPHETAGPGAVWLDLLKPNDQERASAERSTGLVVPALSEIAEIESSSRLSRQGKALYLSMPMAHPSKDDITGNVPLGFVLSPEHLLTVRFAEMPVFDSFAERFASGGEGSSAEAFVGLVDAIVDRLADVLEMVGGKLDEISRQVFRPAPVGRGKLASMDLQLRSILRSIGEEGERVSNIRDSLLGLQRVALYVHDVAADWFPPALLPHLLTARQDLASLSDYDVQLTNKIQFLLDATLGFINIEQNNGIKVLTVVSVVGVPPTLIASIYGMNFKNIPELDWAFGYQWGLSLIALSAVLPLIWFKRKGWI